MSKVLWERIPNVGSKARESAKATSLASVSVAGFSACECQKKSVVYERAGRQRTRGPTVVAYLQERAVDASVPADFSERAMNAMIGSRFRNSNHRLRTYIIL